MSAFVLVRRVLPFSSLLLAVACEPLTCQGRVTDGFQAIAVDDIPELPPKCDANNTDFIGDVDIDNQAELDTLIGCQRVKGAILIHDSDDIVDLAALSTLERIDNGYLLLLNNAALTTVNLPVLENLDNGFTAIDNPSLTQINVPELPVIKGDLTLRNNPVLAQVTFPKVEQVQTSIAIINQEPVVVSVGNVILGELPALTSLRGSFPVLKRIEGALEVYATGLSDFSGLEQLQEILNAGGLAQPRTIFRADKLNPGLAIGIDFDDQFNIVPAGNPNLQNFTGLGALDVVNGDIVVAFNPELRDFSGFDDITTVANMYVFENDNLVSFLGLEGDNNGDGDDDGLSVITGSLFVGVFFDRFGKPIAGGNDSLVNLDGLDSLTAINSATPGGGLPRGLILGFNDKLENLEGLDLLATLNGDLTILGSQQLQDLKGALVLETIGGDLNFGQLLRVDGQPFDPDEAVVANQLTDINGAVKNPGVKFNPDGGQNGFDALTTVNGDLIVAFSDLADLRLSDPDTANLTTIGGRLILYGNAQPDNLAGVETINSLGGLVVNFAVDAFGELRPFDNDGFNDFTDLNVANLGAGGLHIGFDDDIDDAGFATLDNFNTIAGSVTMARAINQNNLGPVDLNELNVNTIGGDLVVCAIRNGDNALINADLGNLENLNLNGVNVVNGDVIVAFCSNLANTAMSIANVGGSFELTGLPALDQVANINLLTTAGEVLLHDLPNVTNINIPNLNNVLGNLEIVNNPQLDAFDFNLANVGGTLRLVDLGELDDVNGLNTLDTVGGDLEIVDCDAVSDTTGLNDLDTVGGDLRLRRLTSITNQAQVGGAQELSFASLVQVGGLEITGMEDLEDLAGLQTLVRVGIDGAGNLIGGGALIIDSNPKLKTLFGLQGITAVGRKISILNNPLLDRFAFDDDDNDRELDIDEDNDGGADEEDDTNESGFSEVLVQVGAPVIDESGVILGGQTGVIEIRNNPLLREKDGDDPLRNNRVDPGILDTLVANLDNFEGLVFLCGNEDSIDDDSEPRVFRFTTCAGAQDGIADLISAAGGEGEGE